MRLAITVLPAMIACAGTAAPPATPCPAPAAIVAPPSEAHIKQRSHDVLRAFDRGDVSAFGGALAKDFIHFEGGAATTGAEELAALTKREPGAPIIAARTWEHEQVFIHPDHILFVGKATEQQAGNEVHDGGYRYLGWYTLQWVPEGEAWKLRYWTWQRASEHGQRDTWNDIYKNAVGFTKQPNRLLVDTVRGRPPGRALDLTMGQGRNALFLAAEGWKVTGVDLADEGLRIAREEAAQRKLALEMIEANIDAWDFGVDRWDLVTMIYAGNHDAWFAKVAPSLKRGGLFVLEYFAFDPARGQDDGIKPGELAKQFGRGFEIVRDEVVEDVPDWAMNRAKLQRFVARKR